MTDPTQEKLDALRQRVIDLFDGGFRTRGAEAMTAADALRELVGLPAQGAAHAMARHPEVRARERAEEERDVARAEVERLTRERDDAREKATLDEQALDEACRHWHQAEAERDAARKEADRLRDIVTRAKDKADSVRPEGIPAWVQDVFDATVAILKEANHA